MGLHSINEEQRLYVLNAGDGYSCLGFDVAFNQAVKVQKWLLENGQTCEVPLENLKGTENGYKQYQRIMAAGAAYYEATGKRCFAELTPELERLKGKRVEVIDCDGNKRRFWVGMSTGWLPVHLEIAKSTSSGGPAVYGSPFRSVKVV